MSRHFHPQPISGEKDFLDYGVRRLSRVAVGKDKSQDTVWKDPPAWWSRECKHPWRNPTAPKQKDILQTLKDKFICLEQHLRKENKIPDDMIEEITEWKENRLSNLFFMTHLSSLVGQCSAISRLLDKLPDKKIEHSNYISSMLAELLSLMEENMQKTKNFLEKQSICKTLEPTFTSTSRLFQKRALEADSTANESLSYPVPKKRPRQPSSHSKSSPSSSHATSSTCTQLPSEILNTIRHNVLSSTSNSIEITPQQPTPTNLFVQPAAVDHNLVKSTMVNKPQHPPVNSEIYPLQSSTSDSQSFKANCFDVPSVEDNYSVMSFDEAYHSDTSSVENTNILPSQAEHSKRHFSECLDILTTDTDVGNNSPHPNDTSILENISAISNMSSQMVFIKLAHSNMSSFDAATSFNDTSWEDHSMSFHHSINSSANSSSLAPSLQINSSLTSFSRMDCYDITVQDSTSDVPYQRALLSGNISPHPTDTSALQNISATSEMSLKDENDCDDFKTFPLSPESEEQLSLYTKVLDEEDIFSSLDSPSPQFISE